MDGYIHAWMTDGCRQSTDTIQIYIQHIHYVFVGTYNTCEFQHTHTYGKHLMAPGNTPESVSAWEADYILGMVLRDLSPQRRRYASAPFRPWSRRPPPAAPLSTTALPADRTQATRPRTRCESSSGVACRTCPSCLKYIMCIWVCVSRLCMYMHAWSDGACMYACMHTLVQSVCIFIHF